MASRYFSVTCSSLAKSTAAAQPLPDIDDPLQWGPPAHAGIGERPAARDLAVIAGHELAEPTSHRIQRHLAEAHLAPGKTLGVLASRPWVMAVGDSWLALKANVLVFSQAKRKELSGGLHRRRADPEQLPRALRRDHRVGPEASTRPS